MSSEARFSKTELLREAKWRTWASDEEAFITECVRVQHPEKGSIPLELREAQREILHAWRTERLTISLKARQVGWSTISAVHCLYLAMFRPDTFIIFLSRNEREAVKLLAKAKHAYNSLPKWVKERGPELLDRNQLKMTFANGSVIESMPSRDDPARGSSAYLIVVDEWAFLENPEEAWAAIQPAADIGGRIIGISTANGYGNFFHDFYVKADEGVNGFKALFFPYWVVPERDEAWYERQKATMPEWTLHQEYPRDPEEAFAKSGRPVFDPVTTSRLAANAIEPLEGRLRKGTGRLPEWVEMAGGELSLWGLPQEEGYVIGADVAEGLDHGDFSSAHVIGARSREVVAHWHGHLPVDDYASVLNLLGLFYNTALLGVEANNHGLSVLRRLKRDFQYPRIFSEYSMDRKRVRVSSRLGVYMTGKKKPVLIDDLEVALRTSELLLYDAATVGELRRYQRNEKGQMEGTPFDDRVMSLAIANHMLPHAGNPDFAKPEGMEPNTFDWWAALADGTLTGANNERPRVGGYNVREPAAAASPSLITF